MTSLEQLIFKCTNETDCNVKVALVRESIVLEVAGKHTLLISGKGLFTYYVSQKQGFLHPPSPLRQQWSAFG